MNKPIAVTHKNTTYLLDVEKAKLERHLTLPKSDIRFADLKNGDVFRYTSASQYVQDFDENGIFVMIDTTKMSNGQAVQISANGRTVDGASKTWFSPNTTDTRFQILDNLNQWTDKITKTADGETFVEITIDMITYIINAKTAIAAGCMVKEDCQYKIGQKFIWTRDGAEYMLVAPTYKQVALIELKSGNRFAEATTVKFHGQVTNVEFAEIIGINKFTPIN